MPNTPPSFSLEDVRRDIDAVDDQLVDLLAQRFALTGKVKQAKQGSKDPWPSPLRPSREIDILRRLVARAKDTALPPELLVRLWRGIISQSGLTQAGITLHVSRHLNSNLANRLKLRDHFGPIQVEECKDEAQALLQVDVSPGDLCIVETEAPWAEAFAAGKAGAARIVAALPVIKNEPVPKMLVIGQAPLTATGEDETVVISTGKLPRDFAPAPLWEVRSGHMRVTSLPGFMSDRESPLLGLARSNASLGLKLAGQYASAIEI